MDLSDTPEQARYRERVRAWLREHRDEAPEASGSNEDTDYIAARRRWQGALAEGGLAGVTWPPEYGGQGLGPVEQVIVGQEISAAGVPGILDTIGVGMLPQPRPHPLAIAGLLRRVAEVHVRPPGAD